MTNLDSVLKSRDITLPAKALVKAMVFPVVMYGCERWTIKKAKHWRIDAFELWCWRRLESSLDFKEIKPVNPKGNQHWIFIGRTDAETEAPILWLPDTKNWLLGKNPDSGKDWKQEEKGTIEEEVVGWHHCLDGHEFEQALRVGDGQGSLACCSPWGREESDTTEQLNWTDEINNYTSVKTLIPMAGLLSSSAVSKFWKQSSGRQHWSTVKGSQSRTAWGLTDESSVPGLCFEILRNKWWAGAGAPVAWRVTLGGFSAHFGPCLPWW